MAARLCALALAVVVAEAFVAPAASSCGRRFVAVRSGGEEDVDGDLTPAELEKFAKEAPTPEEEADLFAMLKEKFTEFEGSTYGEYRGEEEAPGGAAASAFGGSDSLESALRAEIGKLPKEEQDASDRRVLESIFDRGAEEFRESVEAMKAEDVAIGEIAAQELAEEMAAEARAFETRMDAALREAGIDPTRADRPAYDDDVLVTMDSFGAAEAPDSRFVRRAKAAPAAPKAVEPVLVAGAAGDAALRAKVLGALAGLGYGDAALEATGPVGTLVLVGAADAEAKRLVETHRPGRVVVLSAHGVTRSGEFAFLLRRGKLDAARAVEGAAKLALAKLDAGGSSVVVRAGAAEGAAGPVEVAVGDALDAPTSPDVAARALALCCVADDVANATLAVAGGDDCSDDRWRDLALKARGPELARLPAPAIPFDDLVAWVKEWALLWRGDAAKRRLTTPVDVFADGDGAALLFNDKRAKKTTKSGGVLVLAERPTIDGVVEQRLRAVRADYSDGVAVKQMSEDEILVRLEADFAKTFGPM